jgi:hypothetical protein
MESVSGMLTSPSDVNVPAVFNCTAKLLFLTCTCTVVFAPHAPVGVYAKSGGVPKWKKKASRILYTWPENEYHSEFQRECIYFSFKSIN